MIRIVAALFRVVLVLAMKIAIDAIVRAWLAIRPIRRWRTRRAMKSWRAEHPDEILESFHDDEGKQVEKLSEILGKLRTSTKAGAAGFLPLIAVLPFYQTVNDYLLEACKSEQ